jgi:exonuclease III
MKDTSKRDHLSIISYNCHGFSAEKIPFIKQMLTQSDILLLQEHWLQTDNLYKLTDSFQDVYSFAKSGINSEEFIAGRGYGGVAIFINNNAMIKFNVIKTQSNRLYALELKLSNIALILCNLYMPCDSNNATNIGEYEEVLSEVSMLHEKYSKHFVIIAGDYNTDLSRPLSWHTLSLNEFIRSENVCCCAHLDCNNIDFTYCSKSNGTKSTLDHFLISSELKGRVISYNTLDDGDNLSDHSPILLSMSMDNEVHNLVNSTEHVFRSRPKWCTASHEDVMSYQNIMDKNLSALKVPIGAVHCKDYNCVKHNNELQIYHDSLIKVCLEAASISIPFTKDNTCKSNVSNIPGWSEYVEGLRQTSLFWHKLWKENGSPHVGIVAEIRRRTRAQYHYGLRCIRRNKELIISENLSKALCENKNRNFWSEIKRVGHRKSNSSFIIDGISVNSNIADHFGCKYNDLYNSVGYDIDSMKRLTDIVHEDISSNCSSSSCTDDGHLHHVTLNMVDEAIKHIKSGKVDGSDGLVSDHIINSTSSFKYHVSMLFTGMLCHGFTPRSFLLSTMLPIPKNKQGNLSDSNNYRAIALSSLLCKVFDWLIIPNQKNALASHELQFGFKPKCSTILCSAMLQETISYYINKNSNVFLLLLDASKAFDRVNFVSLFEKLYKREMCPLVLRLIMNMYTESLMCVKWESTVSSTFGISNGVKQGGVLSPLLFNVYIDGLLTDLEKSGYGCYIGSTFAGAFGYADDLAILAPTQNSLKYLANICEKYANDYCIKFNANKSKIMHFSCKDYNKENISNLIINGEFVNSTNEDKHLGNTISYNIYDRCIGNTIRDFYRKSNSLLTKFPYVSQEVKSKLHTAHCMDVYGSQLWNFNEKYVNEFYIAWRKIIRKIWGLPYNTHNKFIHIVNNCLPINLILEKKCMSFIFSTINSTNKTVHSIVDEILHCSNSTFAENYRYFMYKYSISKEDWYKRKIDITYKVHRFYSHNGNLTDDILCSVIKDLWAMLYRTGFFVMATSSLYRERKWLRF